MTPLAKFIAFHYGSQKLLADQIGVGEHTISRWCRNDPTAILKWLVAMTDGMSKRDARRFAGDMLEAVRTTLE